MIETGSRKILFFSITITLLIMAIVYSSFNTGRNISVRYSSLADTAMAIKLEVTTAHLWLEEALGGDQTIEIEKVWDHIDQSEWYAYAMLNGGEKEGKTFHALKEPNLRHQVEETLSFLQSFRQIAKQRWNTKSTFGIGSEIDQQFELAFLAFNQKVDNIATTLYRLISKKLQTFEFMAQLLQIITLILGGGIAGLLLRYNKKINKNILTLHKQEESLRITLNSISEAVIVTDTQGTVTYINPIANQLTGWGAEQAVGQPLADIFTIVHRHTGESINNSVNKIIKMDLIVGLVNHAQLIAKEGTKYHISYSRAPLRNPAGEISGVVLVFRDITEEYTLNSELESSQALINTLLDTVPDLICLKDKEGVYLACNAKFERMMGLTKSEILGKTDYDFSDKKSADGFRYNDLQALMSEKKTVFEESATFADDGHREIIETIKTPMKDSGGQLIGILSVARDVTNYKHSLAQLRESESRLKAAQAHAKIGYWELQVDLKAAYWSEQMYTILGFTQGSKGGPETLLKVMDKNDFSIFMASIKKCLATGCEHHFIYQITRLNDGGKRWIECRGKLERDNEGEPQKISGFTQDITEQKRAQERLQLSYQVFNDIHEGIMITDPEQCIVEINPAFSDITGYSREDIIGKPTDFLYSDKQRSLFSNQIWQTVKEKGCWQGELWSRTKQGDLYAVLLTISVLKNELDQVSYYVGMFSDITSSKRQQDKLTMMAHYDVLTKLPNRALFVDRFNQSIAHSMRTGQQLAVGFLDLDNFKPVNDNYGHDVGDRLLIEVAERISSCIRGEDTLSRQGGDEFAILLNNIDSASQYESAMQRIHNALVLPYSIDGIQHTITASSGVTLYPSDNGDIDTLLRHADQAMYQSKLAGKNRFRLYSPDSDQRIIKKNTQLEEIEQALIHHEFQLYYQPKVNMVTGDVFGVEALIRWIHPEKGLIPPLDFLPFIDGTPLEIRIGEWVIKEALQQLDEWQLQGIKLEVSVNISSNHLLSPSFTTDLENSLAAYGPHNAQYLQLEILESSAFGDINTINHIVEICQKKLGISLALDDFGTGYSSLTHLRSLPVNTIKIDQSFVRDMLDDPSDYAIIEGVIALTKSFSRKVIAEGVETTKHGLMLLLMGCEEAQGYGIAKPMPAAIFSQWLSDYIPNQSWLHCGNKCRNNKENSLDIFKMINQQWIDKFRQKVNSLPDQSIHWPLLDNQACQCGNWLHREKQEQLFEKVDIQRLEQAHNKIHRIANVMQGKYLSNALKIDSNVFAELELAVEEMAYAVDLCE